MQITDFNATDVLCAQGGILPLVRGCQVGNVMGKVPARFQGNKVRYFSELFVQ